MVESIKVGFKKVYLLIYDYDHGNREDCNIFYSPIEVFNDPAVRGERIQLLTQTNPEIGYRVEDLDVMHGYSFPIPDKFLDEDYNEDDRDTDDQDDNEDVSENVEPVETGYKPSEIYFHVELNQDYYGKAGFVPRILMMPKEEFDKSGQMWDQEFEMSVDLGNKFVQIMPSIWQYKGTMREAYSTLIGYGFVENSVFSDAVELTT